MAGDPTLHSLFEGYFSAYAVHDAAGCAAIYAEEAVLYTSFDAPMTGRAAIQAAHSDWFEEGEEDKQWSISFEQVAENVASCVIDFSAKIPDGNGYALSSGHSLSALARDENGDWTVKIMSLTMSEP